MQLFRKHLRRAEEQQAKAVERGHHAHKDSLLFESLKVTSVCQGRLCHSAQPHIQLARFI